MSGLKRKLIFSATTMCLTLVLGTAPALAKTHHRHHVAHHNHVAKGSSIVRIAQRHLSNLGYYSGKIDGIMGPGTRAAIKKFQREQGLKSDGVLGSKTQSALDSADIHANAPADAHVGSGGGFLTHEAVRNMDLSGTGTATNPDYAPGLGGGTVTVSSRFAQIEVTESGSGAAKRYDVNVNGDALLVADGQPTVIRMSPTYDLGNEDAIVFTTYSPNASGCIYRSHVLALGPNGGRLLDIDNCTRDYQATVKNGSLWITFSDRDAGSVTGSTWRLEGTSLSKL